jgi:hypothetical protein
MSCLRYLCLFVHSGVQHILILFCLYSSCVLYVGSLYGLSFFYCPFGILYCLFTTTQYYLYVFITHIILPPTRGPGWLNELGSWIT